MKKWKTEKDVLETKNPVERFRDEMKKKHWYRFYLNTNMKKKDKNFREKHL